jgi:hypothetical protein
MIRYANVNGVPTESAPGLKGVCPGCGNSMIAKCGILKIHHWAHQKGKDCDLWWEPMTEWHLKWQNEFPVAWRERILRDEHSGEFHRADIHSPQGVTIEFQHSPVSVNEIESRNAFYRKLIWVVDAQPFRENFILTDTMNPASPLLTDYHFIVDRDGFARFPRFYLRSEYSEYGPALSRIYNLEELSPVTEERIKSDYQFKLFTWNYKRKAWLNSSAPVFLDFGDYFLYRIRKRDQIGKPLLYLQIVTKKNFLAKYI